MQQALRALDIQYQDLPQIYRCVQHLSAIETTLQQCELWHMTKLDVLAGQFRNAALRLERLAPQGAETTITPPELPRREMNQPKKSEESPQPFLQPDPLSKTIRMPVHPCHPLKSPGNGHGRYLWPEWLRWPVSAEQDYGAGRSLISRTR